MWALAYNYICNWGNFLGMRGVRNLVKNKKSNTEINAIETEEDQISCTNQKHKKPAQKARLYKPQGEK